MLVPSTLGGRSGSASARDTALRLCVRATGERMMRETSDSSPEGSLTREREPTFVGGRDDGGGPMRAPEGSGFTSMPSRAFRGDTRLTREGEDSGGASWRPP